MVIAVKTILVVNHCRKII